MPAAHPLLIVLAIAAIGCSGRGRAHPTPDGGAATADDSGAPITGPRVRLLPSTNAIPAPPPVVLPRLARFELLDAGKAPRSALRYELAAPSRADVTIASNITARSLTGGTWSEPIGVPELRYGLGLTPGLRADDGASTTVLVRGLPATVGVGPTPELAPEAKQRADEYLARYRGLVEGQRATVTVDGRGLLGAVTIDGASPAPAISTAELQQIWITSSVPVPTEAIGAGARWRATTHLRRGAAVVEQIAEYQLVAVETAPVPRWKIAVDVKHIGEPQLIRLGDTPESPIADLVGLFFEARGEVTIDPRSPLPASGTMSVELRVHVRMKHPGRAEDLIDESMGTVTIAATGTESPP